MMDCLHASCAIGFIVAALILIASVVFANRRRSRDGTRVIEVKVNPVVDDVLEELAVRFLAYALYQVMVERGTNPAVKDKIYREYGKINMCPTLDNAEIFRSRPELRCDGRFLQAMNRWLMDNGQQEESDYFSAAEAIGRVAVERFRSQAEKIVESC